MTIRMFPFATTDNTINVPGHYKGIVCHSCLGTAPGHDIYIPYGWVLNSCEEVSPSSRSACQSSQFAALIEITHKDFSGTTSHPIQINSNPPGAQIHVDK